MKNETVGEIEISLFRYSVASDPSGDYSRVDLIVTLETLPPCVCGGGVCGGKGSPKPRLGTASRFLSEDLKEGSRVLCRHQTSVVFRVGLDPSTPVVMVANGCGIAPFR